MCIGMGIRCGQGDKGRAVEAWSEVHLWVRTEGSTDVGGDLSYFRWCRTKREERRRVRYEVPRRVLRGKGEKVE